MAETQTLLLLSERDNVLVALCPISGGPQPVSDGSEVTVATPVTLGHKVARRAIASGEVVRKYGVPIGSATRAIAEGEHVHVHNMKSDYTATHTLEETAAGGRHA